jgi:hypothetical protein
VGCVSVWWEFLFIMRTVEAYLDQMAKFRAMAAATSEPTLRKRYSDLSECYRLLAEERERLIDQGVLEPDPPRSA